MVKLPDMTDIELANELLEALPYPVALFDEQERCRYLNDAYRRILRNDGLDAANIDSHAEAIALAVGDTDRKAIDALATSIRSFGRAYEVVGSAERALVASCHQTSQGKRLLTLREVANDLSQSGMFRNLIAAFEGSGIGIIYWDDFLRIRAVNHAWCDMAVPTTVGAHLREHALDLVASGRVPVATDMSVDEAADAYIGAVFAGPLFVEGRHSDGRIVQYRGFPLAQGGIGGFCFDVTAIRSSEDRARALLEEMVESLEEGIGLYDADLVLRMSNSALHKHAHGDATPLPVGSSLAEHCDYVMDLGTIALPDGIGRSDFKGMIEAAVRSHARGLTVKMSDGRIIELSSFPTAAQGYLVSMRDVTAKTIAKQAQEDADTLIRTIIAASPSAFVVSRLSDGSLLHGSPVSDRSTGVFQSAQDLFAKPALYDAFQAELEMYGRVDDFPVALQPADSGERRHGKIDARIAEFRGESIVVASVRDETEKIRMEKELQRERERSYQAEKLSSLGEMLTGIAHELNNPLSVVAGYAHILHEASLAEDLARPIREISAAADRCVKIVRSFLAMASQRPGLREPMDINEIVNAAVDAVMQDESALRVKVVRQLSSDLPSVEGDEDQILQVFVNLILNAVQAMLHVDAPEIQIASYSIGSSVVVSVADNGPGIPEKLRGRIFEPFFSTKPQGHGTGIGLALSTRIVEGHKGRIDVSASESGGARFEVVLPGSSTAYSRIENVGINQQDLQGLTVLIMDNDGAMCGVMREILVSRGVNVCFASKMQTMLAMWEQRDFDILLVEAKLLDFFASQDRFMLTDQLFRRTVLLVGDTGLSEPDGLLLKSDRRVLQKPIDGSDLLAVVHDLSQLLAKEER